MKNATILTTLLILVAITNVMAQTTYNVTSNITTSALNVPSQCNNCRFIISSGATLTLNNDQYLQNVSFDGGTINVNPNKTMTFWAPGSFTNTKVNFANGSTLISSGALTINNSTFTYLGSAKATFWAAVNMTASSMKFLGDAGMESTAAFNMSGTSSLIAGDGTSTSAAFIKFNGGVLNEYDQSYITLLGVNNSYFNWSPYNQATTAIATAFNTFNCGVAGKPACSAPVVYGPAGLTIIGVGTNAILPVKLSAFNVKLTGVTSNLTWTTDIEQKSSRFEIERSVDGINWNRVGSVKAQGNSTVKVNYSYNDVLKGESVMSYRLKIIDQDATFAYSAIKTVKTQGGVAEMKIFPNPATEYVVISAKNNANKMNVQLINLNGQILKQTNGNGNIQMSVNGVNAGSYVVRVTDATGTAQSFKLMIN